MNGICNVSLRVEKGYYYISGISAWSPFAAMENTTSQNFKKAYIDFIHLLGCDFPAVFASLAFLPLFLQSALCVSVSAH